MTFVWFWNDNSTTEEGFDVFARIGTSGPFSRVRSIESSPPSATGSTGAIGYIDPFPANTQFQFQVFGYVKTASTTDPDTAHINSLESNTVSINVPAANTFAVPTNFTATAINGSETDVRFQWADQSTRELGVELWVSRNSGVYQKLTDIMFYESNPIDLGLTAGNSYRFKLRAFHDDAATRTVTAFTPEAPPTNQPAVILPFNPPSGLSPYNGDVGSDYVTLSWFDSSSAETSYEILGHPGGTFNNNLLTVFKVVPGNSGQGTIIARVPNLTPGLPYSFVVRGRSDATNPIGFTAYSNAVSITTKDGITSPQYVQMYVNQPFTYNLTTSNSFPVVFTSMAEGEDEELPPGLTYNGTTKQITGTPTTTGVTQVTMEVDFQNGWEKKNILALRVLNPPTVTNTIGNENMVTGSPVTINLANKFNDPEATSAARVTVAGGNSPIGSMDLIFFEGQALATVDNFKAYMNETAPNNYNGTVFHRSVPGFVVQGGAFRDVGAPNLFSAITVKPKINNQFHHSNIRGTVAMAKVGDDPNSATNQWFINLGNNGLHDLAHATNNLDVQNQGFTVFARVAGNGNVTGKNMAVADNMALKPTGDYAVKIGSNAAQLFEGWPLNSTTGLALMDTSKVLRMTSVAPVPVMNYTASTNTGATVVNASVTNTLGNPQLTLTPIDSGTTTVTVKATNLDGAEVSQSFQVNVISNVATLSGLVPSAGTLSPALSSGITNYTVNVPNNVTSFTLTPTAASGAATVAVEGVPLASGAASQVFTLNVGSNEIELDVEAEDGTDRHYVVTVNRSALRVSTNFVQVNEGVPWIDLELRRESDATGTANFTVSTQNGTATAGQDFTAKVNEATVFPMGATSMNVRILLGAVGASEPNETFTVVVAGGSMAVPEIVTVLIIDSADSTKPTVTLASPAATAKTLNLNTGTSINIMGTAGDNRGLKRVEWSFNGAPFTPIPISTDGSSSPTSASFNFPQLPRTGVNTISLKSIDLRNNESVVLTRTFTVLRPLPVTLSGSGGMTAGYTPDVSYREVGKSYTLTATSVAPSTTTNGTLFSGWTIGGIDAAAVGTPALNNDNAARVGVAKSALEKNVLTFTFREGMTLTANFEPNSYPNIMGVYNGLVRPATGQPRTNASEGFITATVQNSGGFSGKLTIDGTTLSVSGSFDHQGHARFGTARAKTLTVARTNKPSLMVELFIDIDTPGLNDRIWGSVTAKSFQQSQVVSVSEVDADRAFYNGVSQIVPSEYLIASTNGPATFTTVFPPLPLYDGMNAVETQVQGVALKDYPQGTGIGTITVSKTGVVTLSGTLADGTIIGASSTLSQVGVGHASRFPLFMQLYGKLGFLSGFVQLDHAAPGSDISAVNLQWLRPTQTGSHYYPHGWPSCIKVNLLAARYELPNGSESVLRVPDGSDPGTGSDDLQEAGADDDGNASLIFSHGHIEGEMTKAVSLSATDVVTNVPDNDPTFLLKVDRKTGMISGSVAHPDDTRPDFKGVILRKGTHASGYGYFLTKQPRPIDYMGESGHVLLLGHPQ